MDEFEIDLPEETALTVNVTDKSLYNYDFTSFSLLPLQKIASASITEKIKNSLLSNVSQMSLVNEVSNKDKTEYVAKLSEVAQEKLNSGEWGFGIKKKTGETYAVIKDNLTGKTQSFVNLEEKVTNDLGTLPELSAIQGQLASISEQIENLNRNIQRVEQGQYNDRFAGFFSARQLVIEGLASKNEDIKKDLLLSSIKETNTTIGKLMFSIHEDSMSLIDTKTKSKEAKRIDGLLQNSLGYLNASVQLNLIAYTALEEEQSLFATLTNYYSFIQQELMREIKDGRTVAWLLDNSHVGTNGRVVELSSVISKKVENLIESYDSGRIEVSEYEKIESENL